MKRQTSVAIMLACLVLASAACSLSGSDKSPARPTEPPVPTLDLANVTRVPTKAPPTTTFTPVPPTAPPPPTEAPTEPPTETSPPPTEAPTEEPAAQPAAPAAPAAPAQPAPPTNTPGPQPDESAGQPFSATFHFTGRAWDEEDSNQVFQEFYLSGHGGSGIYRYFRGAEELPGPTVLLEAVKCSGFTSTEYRIEDTAGNSETVLVAFNAFCPTPFGCGDCELWSP